MSEEDLSEFYKSLTRLSVEETHLQIIAKASKLTFWYVSDVADPSV